MVSDYLREQTGCTHDGRDAMSGKPVVAADLLALESLVAIEESLAQGVATVEDDRQAVVNVAQAVAQSQQHKR